MVAHSVHLGLIMT